MIRASQCEQLLIPSQPHRSPLNLHNRVLHIIGHKVRGHVHRSNLLFLLGRVGSKRRDGLVGNLLLEAGRDDETDGVGVDVVDGRKLAEELFENTRGLRDKS